MGKEWLQIRGDPSIRRFLFEQERSANEFDKSIDTALNRVCELLHHHGVFHAKVHFSSGQVTLWLVDDPMRYRVHVKEEFLQMDCAQLYAKRRYPDEAVVEPTSIPLVLDIFKHMRIRDPQLYLRSGSLNLINGIVGLNFSCDGSHYLYYTDFLEKSQEIF